MATIVEVSLPSDEFALHHTLTELDGISVRIERTVTQPTHLTPYIWFTGTDINHHTLEPCLNDDPSLGAHELMTETDSALLYRLEWDDAPGTYLDAVTANDAVILTADGNAWRWFLRLLFPSRDAISACYQYCQDHDLPFEVNRIYDVETGPSGQLGLTAAQKDIVTTAYHEGYYEVPRKITLHSLSEQEGVSHQALSERLRRAHHTLVKNSLIDGVIE